jgi:hypothetical protein
MNTIIIKRDNATVIFPSTTKLHVMPTITCFSITVAETTNINPLMDAVKDGLLQSFSVNGAEIRISSYTKYTKVQ